MSRIRTKRKIERVTPLNNQNLINADGEFQEMKLTRGGENVIDISQSSFTGVNNDDMKNLLKINNNSKEFVEDEEKRYDDIYNYDSNYKNSAPTKVHWLDENGKFVGPYVYMMTYVNNRETFKREWAEDTSEKFFVKFFAEGREYKLFGFIPCKTHLFEVVGENGGTGAKIMLLGADNLGNDLFSRILFGSQVSLTIPFAGTLISFVLGIILGGVSGYFGGAIDNLIQRIIEVLTALPTIPLWMALSAAIPADIPVPTMYLSITVIISFISWTGLARTVRGKFISLRNEEFVMAAQVAGVSPFKIMTKHLVPGFMSYLIVNLTLGIPSMIIGETSMSFLGLGMRAPATSWGVLLQETQDITSIAQYPWRLIPLAAVIITVLAFNFLGDGLRDAADPYK